jgi:hypothetical protein
MMIVSARSKKASRHERLRPDLLRLTGDRPAASPPPGALVMLADSQMPVNHLDFKRT